MSDELSTALRELAAARATRPVVDGPGIRARAMRRRRRRRTAYALGGGGTAALALLGLALHLHPAGAQDPLPGSRPPAVTAPVSALPSPSAATPVVGTLDLSRHGLTCGRRVLPVLAQWGRPLASTGPMRVVAKHNPRDLTFVLRSKNPVEVRVPYVVELRDRQDRPYYIGVFTPKLKALSEYAAKSDWIGLGAEDAAWFYARAHIGDTLAVTEDPAAR
ncbi:hypothetical protein LXH13_31575 [Streptomyces spinosirectus]|uniref:hypothetical protein n=1 Tax=Streptomyces TaxID=1883 RepID=UPI001C9D9426|nr:MULTISPECIES: hypothetical protein [Streptomyces]MBY8341763.1 hypothetical protein [Streptomyces plumbidurans]UIR21313.1 hypothetical protein LXH13_31575 [Streptomyces spinosirectus]